MHAIHIGIGSHDHLIISQSVETLLDVKGCLQQIELLVLIYHLLRESETVEWFASQREYGLRVHITALRDASAGRVTLSDKDAGFLLAVVLHIAEVDTAVAQLTIMEVGFLGALTGQFRHTGHCLALPLTLLDLPFQHLSHISMDVQIVIHLLLDEVADIFVDAYTIGSHRQRSEFDLRLTLEHRLFHVDGNGCHDTRTDIAILILAEEIADGTGDMLLEGTLVRTALCGMLTIHKRVVLLTILVGMGKGDLDILTLQVDDGIEGIVGHTILQQILQTMTREDATIVIHDGQSRIQIGIVTEHILHDVILELIVQEEGIIRLEEDVCAVLVLCVLCHVADHLTTGKDCLAHLTLAITVYLEMRTQGIDGFHTHTIQTDRLLKRLGVVLTTSIQHRYGLDQLSLRDASTIVAHGDTQVLVDIHLDTVARMHLELVDGVVDHLFQQHVDTVLRQGAVAQSADVHTRTGTHMFHITQVTNVLIVIPHLFVLWFNDVILFCHSYSISLQSY